MLIGNSQAHHILKTYLEAFDEVKHITPFVLVQGPDAVGKMSSVIALLKRRLGIYRNSDIKVLHNLSNVLGKQHTFKVEVKSSDQQIVDKETGAIYEDIGARELASRLSRAPLGDLKVVLIEDIDRMTTSAANALLKQFEEPLPGRLIIGTLNSDKTILDTIASRAFLIRFHRVSDDEMGSLVPQHYTQEMRNALLRFANGAPGRLVSLIQDDETFQSIQSTYQTIKNFWMGGGSIVDQMNALKQRLDDGWSYDQLLEMLLDEEGLSGSDILVDGRKKLMSNVNEENVLWSVMLKRSIALVSKKN